MFSKKIVILIVMLIGFTAVLAASYDSAVAKINNPHPPQCIVKPGVIYEVHCVDEGRDIIAAGLNAIGQPINYDLDWSKERMDLYVALDTTNTRPGLIIWYVTDEAGTTVTGRIP